MTISSLKFTTSVKRCKNLLALVVSAVWLSHTGVAQHATLEENDLSISKMRARALHAEYIGDIYTSLFYFEKIVARDTANAEALNHLAEMFEATRNYKKAEEVYGKVYSKEADKYPFALYKKGLMEKRNGKYEAAMSTFLLFKSKYRNLGDRQFKSTFNRELAGCDSGVVYRSFPNNVLIQNSGTSINHPHAEFSPFQLDSSSMLFGSLRLDTLRFFDVRPESRETQPTRQLYKAVKQDGHWKESGKFNLINDSTMDMGNVVYSHRTHKYYFSKCSKNSKGKVNCKIYTVANNDGKWTAPTELPFPINMDGFTSTQPTIMTDTATPVLQSVKSNPAVRKSSKPSGKVQRKATVKNAGKEMIEYLYFVSDRPGGKGGLDIWYSSFNLKKNQWNAPINFMPANTAGEEYTPFYHHEKQKFYFSSDGHVSAGGLDIYQLTREGGKFTNVTNMSFPINSPQDDLGFMVGSDTSRGFLVSNRPGGTPYFHETCCDDIFSLQLLPPTLYKNILALTIVDSTATCADHKLTVVSYDVSNKQEYHDTLTVKNCEYNMVLKNNYNYSFVAEREGFNTGNLVVETKNRSNIDTLRKQMVLKPMEKVVVQDIIPDMEPTLVASNLKPEPEKLLVPALENNLKTQEVEITPITTPTQPGATKPEPKADPINLKTLEKIEEKPVENVPFVLKDIQYATDQAALNPKAIQALDSLLIPFLKLHPEDKIIIASHTDDQASNNYNMELSKRRADNVVQYLTFKGIAPERLEASGYGETKPIAPNTNNDGSDNPEGRKLNRRTEFFLGTHSNPPKYKFPTLIE